MASEPGPVAADFMSDDDISLNSSDSEQEEEYTVEEIVAERIFDDMKPRYLVKWENYGEERCTWEPAESFLDPRSLQNWAKKRDAGLHLARDLIDKIHAKINAYHEEKALRKARRQAKRRRLAARPSGRSMKTSGSAITSRRQQDTVKTIRPLTTSGRKRPGSDDTGPSPILRQTSNALKAPDHQSVSSTELTTSKGPVYHGISNKTVDRSGEHARRTGNKRNYKTTSFRNLRHLNNARKVARREPSPDITKIKLRSLADWAESAPEDTNLQLPPLSASSTSWSEGGKQSSADGNNVTSEAALGSILATNPSRDLTPNRLPNNNFDGSELQNLSSSKTIMTQKRANPYESQERKLRTFANGRFVYFPGEFLADLTFGRAHIGDVRIGGLPSWAIGHIIRLRTANRLRLEIGSNDVVTPAQWAQLCTGRSNALQTTGVVIPFEDTENTVTEMERYLHQHNLAALWYHPTEDFMLVLYSPRSSAWLFLERMGGLPLDSNLRVLTRNKMPPTESLAVDKLVSEDSNNRAANEQLPVSSPHITRSFSALSTIDGVNSTSAANASDTGVTSAARSSRHSVAIRPDSAVSTCSPIGQPRDLSLPGHLAAQLSSDGIYTFLDDEQDPAFRHSSDKHSANLQSNESGTESDSFELVLQPGQSISDAFKKTFRMPYDHLTAVPPSKNVDRNPAKARFYLVYPETAQRELAFLQKFLRSYTFQTNICTSLDERGWEAFQNIYKGDYIGVILFHDDCTNYHTLPRLASFLKSSSLTVFRVSLSKPLKYCEDRCHIERLFPSGMAILLTEAAMINDGAAILKWFGKKRKGPGWKLIVRPNIRNWLQNMALSSAPERTERFIEMLQELDKLSPGFSALRHHSRSGEESSSDAESIDGLSDSSGGPGPVFAPSFIPAYDRPPSSKEKGSDEQWKDRILIEFFAGWGIAHAGSHRKFVAITPFSDKEYSKWGHIEVLRPEKFMQREGIETEQQAGIPKS